MFWPILYLPKYSQFRIPYSVFRIPYSVFRIPNSAVPCSLFPVPYSLFPIPCSLFPIPYSLFPIPYSLFPIPYYQLSIINYQLSIINYQLSIINYQLSMKNFLARLDWSYFYALLGEGTLALTFVLYIILARELGPERYEIFAAAAALAAILSLFINFGLSDLLTREVAAKPEEGPKSTVKFLILEVLNTLPVLVILLPIAHLLNFQGQGLIVCYLMIFAELCRNLKMTQRGVLKGMGWFRSETISVAIERSAVVLCSIAVLLFTNNLVWVVTTLVVVRLLENIGLLYYLSRKVTTWSAFNFNSLVASVKMAYPFALAGVLWVIYYQVDVVMLKAIAPMGEAGFYSVAVKIMEIFSALPRVIFYVAFTRFARAYATDPDLLPPQIYKATRLLVVLVLPVILIAGFFQTTLVQILYGDNYSYSVQSLSILLPNITVAIFGQLVQQTLIAIGQEKRLPPILLGAVVANVATNAILIPVLGAIGAAIATILSELVRSLMLIKLLSALDYKSVGNTIRVIAGMSLLITAIPSLMLYGLTPIIGIGLIGLSIAGLMILLRRDRFLDSKKQ